MEQHQHQRDSLIISLLASNAGRIAWPISSVLPLITHLGHKITYADFVTLLAKNPHLDRSTHEDAKKLTRKMFEKDDERETVSAFEHYTGDRSCSS
jgi:hypothetical protein